jgi:hypothetical protein
METNKPAPGLEALAIKTREPIRVEITHPATGEPIRDVAGMPAYIEVVGLDSPEFKAHERAMIQRRLKSRNPKAVMTAEQLAEERLEMLCACTVGWYLVAPDGQPIQVSFSPAEARRLYSNPDCGWITRQIDKAIGDEALFMKSSSAG